MITAWRIYKPRHHASAFTGAGARLHAGRWNSKGIPVVYTSASISLACLELLVHLQSRELLQKYVLIPCTFERSLVLILDPKRLPRNWRGNPAPLALRDLGDDWFASAKSPILAVPSAIVPRETNYLLNPLHPDFSKIQIGPPSPLQFDPRLLKLP